MVSLCACVCERWHGGCLLPQLHCVCTALPFGFASVTNVVSSQS